MLTVLGLPSVLPHNHPVHAGRQFSRDRIYGLPDKSFAVPVSRTALEREQKGAS